MRKYLSFSAAAVLQAIDQGYRYGFDVMDIVGLPSGTVYPALRRMEGDGLIESKWEADTVAQREARPARKYYELTRAGRDALAAAVARYRLPGLAEQREPGTSRPTRSKA